MQQNDHGPVPAIARPAEKPAMNMLFSAQLPGRGEESETAFPIRRDQLNPRPAGFRRE